MCNYDYCMAELLLSQLPLHVALVIPDLTFVSNYNLLLFSHLAVCDHLFAGLASSKAMHKLHLGSTW